MTLTATRLPAVTWLPSRDPASARDARRRAGAVLASWGLGEQADAGELVADELLANAVCHGDAPVWIRLSVTSRGLRVEVHDSGAGRPVRRQAGRGDECGRGLVLIDGLIELHGGERGVISDPEGPGKTVYVVLTLSGTPADAR